MFIKLKNFIITFLIFLAIYQTMGLWFETFSPHSLFYLIKNKVNNFSVQENTMYTVESILVNYADNKFIRKYNNISDTDYKKTFDEVIYKSVKYGSMNKIDKFNLNEIFDKKSVIYTYNDFITGNDFYQIFNFKTNNIQKVDKFDMIVIFPEVEDRYNIKTIFLNSDTLEAYEFKMDKESFRQNILEIISFISNIESKDYYFISSDENNISLFEKNQFLPKGKYEFFSLNNLKVTNPLEKDGGILLSDSEKYVDIFFENPIIKTSSFTNNTYTYNDESIIVKYYSNGLLEYVKYKVDEQNKKESPYKIAIEFLEKDINIKNEYFLKSYKKEDGKIIFKFDYKINNFPIILSPEKQKSLGMDSMIEVTVEKNTVSKYRRLVYDFEITQNETIVEKPFIEAIDTFLTKNNKDMPKIQNMELVYKVVDDKQDIVINWDIYVDKKHYFENVTYKEVNNG